MHRFSDEGRSRRWHWDSRMVGKFLYMIQNPKQKAFMQIYYQIHVAGTEDTDPATLA
jgi:hypothetical protein